MANIGREYGEILLTPEKAPPAFDFLKGSRADNAAGDAAGDAEKQLPAPDGIFFPATLYAVRQTEHEEEPVAAR